MRAAITAVESGVRVTVLDEQQGPGGQIYRNITAVSEQQAVLLGRDYIKGRKLAQDMKKNDLEYIPNATVWHVGNDCTVTYSLEGRAQMIKSDRLIIATGAIERPVPIPGWTLPGVMTAGGGQILLKQSGLIAQRAVIVGSGPLIYLIAQQMTRAGVPPLALVETQSNRDLLHAMKYSIGALQGWQYLKKGLQMMVEVMRAGVKRYTGATNLSIERSEDSNNLMFTHKGSEKAINCDMVYLHQGIVPNTQIARSLHLNHGWDDVQHCFRPTLNQWGQSSNENIYVAGDGGNIIGADAAEYSGSLAALHAATSLGYLTETRCNQLSVNMRKKLDGELAIRPFLNAAYKPNSAILQPEHDTIICRCEEVTAGDIRHYAKLGCTGPNQTKAYGRCGMGPCQGRFCGLTVTELLANSNNMNPQDIGYYRIRPPLKPITLGELATLEDVVTVAD